MFGTPDPTDDNVVLLPLHVEGPMPSACLAASFSTSSRPLAAREQPSTESLPFLTLIKGHVEHSLANACLHADVARTQRDLVAARHQLETRVIERTQELTAEIAERKRTEEQLVLARDAAEAASRAKSAFLAHMSHEFRTPLNAIIGYAELLREESKADGGASVAADCGRVLVAGRHLLRLVNDVLDLSRIGAGKMPFASDLFEIGDLVAEVVTTTQPLAAANGDRIDVNLPADLGSMVGDRTRVAQILLNLLGNAVKFTHGGTVRVDVERLQDGPEPRVVFRIQDTGIGMTPEEIDRLFRAFSQADSSTTKRYGGSGLGLAISQSLSQLMGGGIGVTSEAGRGSTFTVTLPIRAGGHPTQV